jgi:hypothetical protein
LLQVDVHILLDVPVWLQHLSGLHARKHLGDVLQRDHLDLPGLWQTKWLWQPMIFYPEEKKS